MIDEAARKRNRIIGIVAAVVVLAIGLLIAAVLFLGKPLGFQYDNAKKQLESVTQEQEDSRQAIVSYFDALADGKKTDAVKDKLQTQAESLERSLDKLGKEASIVRDPDVYKEYTEFREDAKKLVVQMRNVVKTIEASQPLKNVCSSEVFERLEKTESREAGWQVFKACAEAAGSFDPGAVPDPDYQLLHVMMKKAYADMRRYLTEDEALYDQAMLALGSLAVSLETTDIAVKQRLLETASIPNSAKLKDLLDQKHGA